MFNKAYLSCHKMSHYEVLCFMRFWQAFPAGKRSDATEVALATKQPLSEKNRADVTISASLILDPPKTMV